MAWTKTAFTGCWAVRCVGGCGSICSSPLVKNFRCCLALPDSRIIMADAAAFMDKDNIALLYALQQQYDKLTPDEREAFKPSSLAEVVADVQRLDLEHRARSRTRRFVDRLNTIVTGLQCYFTAFDTVVSSHPDIAGLVWGGLRFIVAVCRHPGSSL
jgi:hypothetical protein